MSLDDLVAAETRFKREILGGHAFVLRVGDQDLPLPFDLAELAAVESSWDEWAANGDDTGPTSWGGRQLVVTERGRRESLVTYARMMARLASQDAALDQARDRLAALPMRLDRRAKTNASKLRAYAAARELREQLSPKQLRKSAEFMVRCPAGCLLAVCHERRIRLHVTERFLLVSRDPSGGLDAAWARDDAAALAGETSTTPVSCKHGSGSLPKTVGARAVRRPDTRSITSVQGARWTRQSPEC